MRVVPTVPATYMEVCTKLPLKYGHLSNEDAWTIPSCPKGVQNRVVPLYSEDKCNVH